MGRTITLAAQGDRRTTISWYEPGETHRAHRHGEAQISCLLAGDYAEDSLSGPREAFGGAVSVKPAGFEHENRFGVDGALILSVALPDAPFAERYRIGRATAGRDLLAAGPAGLAMLCGGLRESEPDARPAVWLNGARQRLASGAASAEVARGLGLHPVRFAALFRAAFREPPSAWRQARRLSRAVTGVVAGQARLADLAVEAGFSDQAHMTRAVKAATGFSPGVLRRLFVAA
ncbi:MAG: AraC family transcriptional regulator [Caulobacter sp.]|nr:AraC family transcriptional regulator [Caulobacter sp.]